MSMHPAKHTNGTASYGTSTNVRGHSIRTSCPCTVFLHMLSSHQTTLLISRVLIRLCSLMDKWPVHHLRAYMGKQH